MSEIMLDIETLSIQPNAWILSIGAVEFEWDGTLGKALDILIHPDAKQVGAAIDALTVQWWMQQGSVAREALNIKTSMSKVLYFKEALSTLNSFIAGRNVWSNGGDFDNTIVRNAMMREGIAPSWGYQQIRCYRTIAALYGRRDEDDRPPAQHIAVEDAIWQAKNLTRLMNAHSGDFVYEAIV
jgi:hypothetical protein